jgi:predicted phosphohydrolase
MDLYFKENNFDTIYILHNNHFKYENYGICGTRGWVNMPNEPSDAKVLAREAQRLEVSVKVAVECGLEPIVFMHYPPIYGNNFNCDILDVLYRYNVKKCY